MLDSKKPREDGAEERQKGFQTSAQGASTRSRHAETKESREVGNNEGDLTLDRNYSIMLERFPPAIRL